MIDLFLTRLTCSNCSSLPTGDNGNGNVYLLDTKLVSILLSHLSSARNDLPLAALHTPIYGVLLAARLVLADSLPIESQPQTSSLSSSSSSSSSTSCRWHSIVTHLVDICFQSSAIVSVIVTNDSPEGFLPETYRRRLPDGDRVAADSQALLVCAWRTIKEVNT